jgi:hypothetical protein
MGSRPRGLVRSSRDAELKPRRHAQRTNERYKTFRGGRASALQSSGAGVAFTSTMGELDFAPPIDEMQTVSCGDPWTRHMRRGDFEAAWRISDAVQQQRAGTACSHLPRHEQYFWDGRSIEGQRVLVRCYHGLGDTIQFIRYLPMLRARARAVIVWAQPSLIPLLSDLPGIDDLLPLHDGDVGVDRDIDIELMELPHLFRTTLETIPVGIPYLQVDPMALPSHEGLAVGLAWQAGAWAGHRSIPFPLLAPLISVPVTWYVLQGYPGLHDRPRDLGIVAGATDLVEAARAIRALDLVITVDSMPAHLAGALGVPVWTLLCADPDWRWMADRDDSPWYPTMRLFRQERAGEWVPVVERAAGDLAAWAHSVQARGGHA